MMCGAARYDYSASDITHNTWWLSKQRRRRNWANNGPKRIRVCRRRDETRRTTKKMSIRRRTTSTDQILNEIISSQRVSVRADELAERFFSFNVIKFFFSVFFLISSPRITNSTASACFATSHYISFVLHRIASHHCRTSSSST